MEFQNFQDFVEKVDRKYKSRYGMVKVKLNSLQAWACFTYS
jgi:hypothetical protein